MRIKFESCMSSLAEGGDLRSSVLASSPFASTECLQVTSSCVLSCATEVTASDASEEAYLVTTHFGPCVNFESTSSCGARDVYCVYEPRASGIHLSNSGSGFTRVQVVSIPNCVCEVDAMCFSACDSLKCVSFGASSKLERICAEAFCETSLESMSIPDSVVELREKCFCECKSLRRVIET